MEFDIVPPAAIREGRATDAYFERTVETLQGAGRNPDVVAEVTADQFGDGTFEVFAGLADALQLFEGLDVDVFALSEGLCFDGGPVLRIEGPYLEFAEMETSLLGFLSQASGWATAAARIRRAAPDSSVMSFGSRHVHPSTTAVLERAALLAGLDGFSHVAAGNVIGREADGTMPHALVICFGQGNQEAAWRAFDDHIDPGVPRVALVDTYSDETDEALRAARAVEDLDSVRLDTTGSRRGDFRHIVREVRYKLDDAGFDDVGIFASGGLTPEDLQTLRDVADGFGVGSAISNADPVDFALDIVECEGEPAAKRGKLPGRKQVYRTPDGRHVVSPAAQPGPTDAEPLLHRVVDDGDIVYDFELEAAVERHTTDADAVGLASRPESE